MPAISEPSPYPAGLRLAGRRVVVVGGGRVAQRRVPALVAAGAWVEVVSPETTPAVEGHALSGEITWTPRPYTTSDLDGAWYVVVATDVPAVNRQVSRDADARRIFCVRSDNAEAATAWTPAVGHHGPLTVAVLGSRDPRRSASVRDEILNRLRSGEIVARTDQTRIPGVTLVGGGPGDPDLITVAGRRALQEADVVIADRLAPRALLAELSPDVEVVDATKLPRGRAASQESINALMIDRARHGKSVVRFKGGDSYVFGRGFEEVQECAAAGVPCRVIPGITSAFSVPALAGIPVTHRGVAHDVTVVAGHVPPGHPESLVNWDALARLRGTVVMLMAVKNLAEISLALREGGRSPQTPCAVVQDGSMTTQRTVFTTLEKLADDVERRQIRPPANVVMGDVVAVAKEMSSLEGADRHDLAG